MKDMSSFLTKAPLLICTLLGASIIHAAQEHPNSNHITRVDKIHVRQVSPPPLLQVIANGSSYDEVSNKHFSIKYSAGVTCKGLWDVHYFSAAMAPRTGKGIYKSKAANKQPVGIYFETLSAYGIDSGKKSINVNSNTMGGPIRKEIREAAIKQCNSEAAKASQQQNISLIEAMSTKRQFKLNSNWVDKNLKLEARASCGNPKRLASWFSVYDNSPTINVVCNARTPTKGINTNKLPSQLSNKLEVKATLKSNTKKYSGKCPKKVVLTGEISTNKAGVIEYQWAAGSAKSIAKKMTFKKAGKRKITRTLDIDKSKNISYSLVIKGPVKSKSNTVNVNVKCTKAASSNLRLTPKTPDPLPQ